MFQLFYVRPTEIYIASILGFKADVIEELRFKLFPGTYHPFNSEELSRCLQRDTQLHLGHSIGIADWRDIQTSFTNAHKDPNELPYLSPDSINDIQRGHGSELARDHYGLQAGVLRGVFPDTILAFRRCSAWWQHITGKQTSALPGMHASNRLGFTGIEPLEEDPPSEQQTNHHHRSNTTSTSMEMKEMMQAIKSLEASHRASVNEAVGAALAIQARGGSNSVSSDGPGRERVIPHPSIIKMLRRLLGKNATFKTPEQAEALEVSLALDRHLVQVGPTASGKSMAFLLPAALRDKGTTIVLLPLSALHLDFERRCQSFNIEYSRWMTNVNEQPRSRIVFVSPEHAMTSRFTDYLMAMSNMGELVQFVIDEVHLVHSHLNFRYCFAALRPALVASRECSSMNLV